MANSLTPRIDKLEPNIVINGAMEIAQRGDSALLSNAYTLDRFYVNNLNVSMTTLVDQDITVPSGEVFSSSLRAYNTTTGSLTADSNVGIRYRVEGYDVLSIWKKAFTLGFWARSSVAATYWVSLKSDGATHSYVRSYDLEADTWTFITMEFPQLSSAPGTHDRDNGIGLEINWSIADGDNLKTSTLNSWHAGDFNRGTGPSNSAWLTSGNEFFLTGVVLFPGEFEGVDNLPFVRSGRNFQEELARAQRYYEKSYTLSTVPGSITTAGSTIHRLSGDLSSAVIKTHSFNVAKRAVVPSLFIYSTATGTVGSIRDLTGAADRAGATGINISEQGFSTNYNGVNITDQSFLAWHWAADAEL